MGISPINSQTNSGSQSIAELMEQQRKQHLQQMQEQFAINSQNSSQQHQQTVMSSAHESYRALANDQQRRSAEMTSDEAAQLKNTTQKLDSSASA
ncbi:hypothetical protein [Brucella anthropi]|uniref:hypothetical protein n=1 Tax=Brucella anthropi TaxID=529 RepID=UPI00384B0786